MAANDRVFKTHDEKLLAEAQASIRSEVGSRIPVDAEVFLSAGQPMRLVLSDRRGNRVEVETRKCRPNRLSNIPSTWKYCAKKLRASAIRPFALTDLKMHGDVNSLVPFSDINDARRRAAELLIEKIVQTRQPAPADELGYWEAKERFMVPAPKVLKAGKTYLAVAVSSQELARTRSAQWRRPSLLGNGRAGQPTAYAQGQTAGNICCECRL